MTEEQWRKCTDPWEMLGFLGDETGECQPRPHDADEVERHLEGKMSERKIRLLGCAICRKIRGKLVQDVVEVAERFVDGKATQEDLYAARKAFKKVPGAFYERLQHPLRAGVPPAIPAANAGGTPARRDSEIAAYDQISWLTARFSCFRLNWGDYLQSRFFRHHNAAAALLVRDLFRPETFAPVTVSPAWLAWNDGTVVKIAQAIYDGHAFDRMPILADALEDAGCDNADILRHCREPGEHARGLLGRRSAAEEV